MDENAVLHPITPQARRWYDAVCNPSLQPILALLGSSIEGNPSQYMFEKAFAHHDLDWRYLSCEVSPDDLAAALDGMRALGFRGGTCADPYRESIGQHLARVTEAARLSGVVNCIVREHDDLIGDDTTGRAVMAAIGRHVDPSGKQVVLLGANSSAQAIAVELASLGVAQTTVVSPEEGAAAQLAGLLTNDLQSTAHAAAWEDEYELPTETEILINALPTEASLPLNLDALGKQSVVADITVDPTHTWLIDEARSREAMAVTGLDILAEQAALDFCIWTEVEPDLAVLRDAAEEFLEL